MRVLARFGPLLPKIAEDALIRQNNPAPQPKPQRRRAQMTWMALGAVLTGAAVLLFQAL
jgi:ubiquinone biosynthesis protein